MSWTGQEWGPEELRFVADLTGDGRADIVGFGRNGVWVAVNKGGSTFSQPRMVLTSFNSQGWHPEQHLRFVVDLTGDGKADIIGFGDNDVGIALSNGDGSFAQDKSVLTEFIVNKGWRVDQHPRFVVDLTGDGKADIVGFGNDGVWTALGNGDGTFQAPKLVLEGFGGNRGWRVDQHPRFVVDLTGDGKADIVGFGNDGVWTALSNGDGTFQAPKLVLEGFHVNQGWWVDQHPRFVVDLTGDGKADIVGFGNDGVWTALGNGDGTFQTPKLVLEGFHVNQGWRVDQHPRFVVDLTGDGKADIVGFGDNGVWTAVSNGDGTFGEPKFFEGFGVNQGWRVDQHPRFVVDLTGNGKADIIGFGTDGVWAALSNGDGTFQAAQFVRDDVVPPPASRRKVLPWNVLQRKFDLFFNERARPMFQLRLDNPGETFGQTVLTVAQEDATVPIDHPQRYDHEHPRYRQELADADNDFHMLNSDKLTLTLDPGPPMGVRLGIRFEADSPIELRHKILGVPFDVDIKGLNIQIKFEFGSQQGLIDLVGFIGDINQAVDSATVTILHSRPGFIDVHLEAPFRGEVIKQVFGGPNARPVVNQQAIEQAAQIALEKTLISRFIIPNADVDSVLPDGMTAGELEANFRDKIWDALQSSENRDRLNKMVTRWLVGGDFTVVGTASDAQSLTIDYIIPAGQLEPFPEVTQPPMEPGPLANIDHIVVLMMENRSFDHMLGYLSKHGGRSDVDGLRGGETNRYKGQDYRSLLLPDTTFLESPDHSHKGVVNQIAGGTCDGFVASFADLLAEHHPNATVDPGRIMGYHNAANVPVYDALAREFLICHRWFSAHPGPTFCNRFYTLTGRLNRDSFGNFEFDNFTGDDFKPVATRTILDHLTEGGVDWRYYEHRYCFLRLFSQYTTDDHFIVDADDPVKGFFACAQAGTLPAVSFIDPNFIDEPDGQDNDDGAPADITAGQNLIGRIVNAVMRGPKWQKTLLIITYDEHGGFYDHVNPLDSRYREKAKPVSGIDHYGLRVPSFVISPWVDQGKASDVVFDHTSIAKTIARRFMSANPPDLGERVAAANDLSMVLRTTPRQDIPSIPVPPAPVPRAAFERRVAPALGGDDFKQIMRTLRDRYAIRR